MKNKKINKYRNKMKFNNYEVQPQKQRLNSILRKYPYL